MKFDFEGDYISPDNNRTMLEIGMTENDLLIIEVSDNMI